MLTWTSGWTQSAKFAVEGVHAGRGAAMSKYTLLLYKRFKKFTSELIVWCNEILLQCSNSKRKSPHRYHPLALSLVPTFLSASAFLVVAWTTPVPSVRASVKAPSITMHRGDWPRLRLGPLRPPTRKVSSPMTNGLLPCPALTGKRFPPQVSISWHEFLLTKVSRLTAGCFMLGESKHPQGSSDAEIGSWSVRKRFGKLRIVDSAVPPSAEKLPAPPRPPKPPHMLPENPGHNYLNLDGATESSNLPPRRPPRRRHLPLRSSRTSLTISRDLTSRGKRPTWTSGSISPLNTSTRTLHLAVSRSRAYSVTTSKKRNRLVLVLRVQRPLRIQTCRVPSSGIRRLLYQRQWQPPPPVVYRELKPGRKTSDSTSIISNEASPGPTMPALKLVLLNTRPLNRRASIGNSSHL